MSGAGHPTRLEGPAPGVDVVPQAVNVKRLFVKEIEDALLEGRVDLAVHSARIFPASCRTAS